MKKMTTWHVWVMALTLAFGGGLQIHAANRLADTTYHNGTIYTLMEEMSETKDVANAKKAEVVATLNGKIIFVGSVADAKARGYLDADKVGNIVDLRGKTMLPGFVDGHGHFPDQGAQDLYQIFLGSPPLGTMTSIADYKEALKVACANSPEGVIGARYDDTLIEDMRHPTWMDIEEVNECIGKKVHLNHMSGHVHVASKDLLLAGNGTDGPLMDNEGNPTQLAQKTAGVEIKNGKVTGVLYEQLAQGLVVKPTVSIDHQSAVARASEVFLSKGVTLADCGGAPVGMMGVGSGRGYEGLFQEALEKGNLHNRVIIHPVYMNNYVIPVLRQLRWDGIPAGRPSLDELLANNAAPSASTPRIGDDMTNFLPLTPAYTPEQELPANYLFLGAYKIVGDGSPQAYTSWTKAPGHYDWGGHTAEERCTKNAVGMEQLEGTKYDTPNDIFNGLPGTIQVYPQNLKNLIELAHRNGISTETHTNGSAYAEMWVEALENAVTKYPNIEDTRHTSIHAQTVERDVVERLAGSYDTVDPAMSMQMFGAFEGNNGNAIFKGMNGVTDKNRLAELMKKQNLFASFFMTHTYYYGERHRDIFFGPGRAHNISPAGWATHYGLRYSFHNDNTVTPIEPLQSMESGVTRLSAQSLVSDGGQLISGNGKDIDATVMLPYHAVNGVPDQSKQMAFYDYDQRINALQALHAVTIEPAYQNKLDQRVGSIEVNKFADFVILDDDPMAVAAHNPTNLSDIRVATTIVNDEVMFGILPAATTYTSDVKAGYLPGAVKPSAVEASLLEGKQADMQHALEKGQVRLGTYAITANVPTAGDVVLFQMTVLGNGQKVADLRLCDVSNPNSASEFTFVTKQTMLEAGMFWISSQKAPTIPLSAERVLKMDDSYIVFFTAADSDNDGKINIAVSLLSQSGVKPDNNSPIISSQQMDTGNSGGCTVGATPSYDLVLLLGILAGLVGLRRLQRFFYRS